MDKASSLTRDRVRFLPWLIRGMWAALPFTTGPALAAALDAASRPVQMVASSGLWLGWAVGMVAAFAPHPIALTTLRVVAPAAVVAAVVAAAAEQPSALAVAWATVACAWAFAPAFGAVCVNGPAYPNERRFLLRPPGALLLGPLPLFWILSILGIGAGPLLLAARQWIFGGLALLAGWPLAFILLKSLHNLSRRWAVFVPAGMVLHDPVVLFDPMLFKRQDVTAFRPATAADAGHFDLSQRAPGPGIAMELDELTTITLLKPGRREGVAIHASGLRFTPTRPGAVIEESRRRRIAVRRRPAAGQ